MILVTGATGFVGRRVVEAFTSAGYPVRALVHTQSRASVLSRYRSQIAYGDVLDPESLNRACEGVEAVVHLVAVLREGPDSTFLWVNHVGTRNILEAATSAGVKRFIHAGVLGSSSDPSIPYLYSRWMSDEEVIRSTIPHTIVRFSAGFGEGDEFFTTLAAQVKLSPVVPVAGDGRTRFQPIAVEDVARCLVTAYQRDDTVGKTIEAGGPEHFTYEEILDVLADTLGAKIVKVRLPLPLLMPALALMEALVPRPPFTREQLKMLQADSSTDLDSVEKAFGFAPRSLAGNIAYVSKIGLGDALKINLGFMPAHICDH